MSRRPHGHATTPYGAPSSPWAICDACGFLYDKSALRWRMDWRGPYVQNLRLLVCERCIDVPQEQLRLIILPPDPPPVRDARPEMYAIEELEGEVYNLEMDMSDDGMSMLMIF